MPPAKIGIFDSGFGGLSVVRAVYKKIPYHPIIYLGDQAHVPYGFRPKDEIRKFSFEITRWLIDQGCELIIIACNTASAAALHDLREKYPDIPFVGMQPAIKPAAHLTRTGKVGVIATPTTFDGELYAAVVEKFASGITVLESTCPGLVKEIEAGRLHSPEVREILQDALNPMLEESIDAVVLGCTHYPFVKPAIRKIVGPHVRIIDPAPAIARQAARLLIEPDQKEIPKPDLLIYTTGDVEEFKQKLPTFLTIPAQIHPLQWDDSCQLVSTAS